MSKSALLNSIVESSENAALFADVQGDILAGGLPKKSETFLFFMIKRDQVQRFCTNLGNATGNGSNTFSSVQKVLGDRKNFINQPDEVVVPSTGANIAFSFRGLQKVRMLGFAP